jgi:predicted kinase
MDLERLGAPGLAVVVERAYAEHTGDPDLGTLLPFYACYRAWVRAKVTALRLAQLSADDPARPAVEQRARDLFRLAQRLAWRGRLPLVLVMCGVGGSGKSTLAAELSERSGLPHVSSDRVRKELAGIPPGEHAPPATYDAAHTERTYAELAERAAAAVDACGGAIVDATFTTRAQRAALTARLRDTEARVLWVECHAPREVLERRGAAREHAPERGSDATWAVIAGQLGTREPLDDIPAADQHAVATDRPVPVCLDEVDCFAAAAAVIQQ